MAPGRPSLTTSTAFSLTVPQPRCLRGHVVWNAGAKEKNIFNELWIWQFCVPPDPLYPGSSLLYFFPCHWRCSSQVGSAEPKSGLEIRAHLQNLERTCMISVLQICSVASTASLTRELSIMELAWQPWRMSSWGWRKKPQRIKKVQSWLQIYNPQPKRTATLQ